MFKQPELVDGVGFAAKLLPELFDIAIPLLGVLRIVAQIFIEVGVWGFHHKSYELIQRSAGNAAAFFAVVPANTHRDDFIFCGVTLKNPADAFGLVVCPDKV